MIHITIERMDGRVLTMIVEGHAETEDVKDDLVCASISILAQTILLSLDELVKLPKMTYVMYDGYLEFTLPEGMSKRKRERADLVIETLLIGIKGTQEMHPQYIEICEREVRSDAI